MTSYWQTCVFHLRRLLCFWCGTGESRAEATFSLWSINLANVTCTCLHCYSLSHCSSTAFSLWHALITAANGGTVILMVVAFPSAGRTAAHCCYSATPRTSTRGSTGHRQQLRHPGAAENRPSATMHILDLLCAAPSLHSLLLTSYPALSSAVSIFSVCFCSLAALPPLLSHRKTYCSY